MKGQSSSGIRLFSSTDESESESSFESILKTILVSVFFGRGEKSSIFLNSVERTETFNHRSASLHVRPLTNGG